MNIPRDFFYANKVEEFVRLMKRHRIDDIIKIMCDRAQESGVSCGESEINSWKCNFEAIHKLLLKSKVAGDAVIAFEFNSYARCVMIILTISVATSTLEASR